MSSANPVQFHAIKVFHRTGDDEYHIAAGISDIHINEEIVGIGPTIADGMDVPFAVKLSDNTGMVVQSSLLPDVYKDTLGQKQTRVLSKIKSAKDNMTKLFKTKCRVSPALSNPYPFAIPCVRQHITVSSPLPPEKAQLVAIASLDVYSEHAVGGHFDDFMSTSRYGANVPSLSSPAQLLALPEPEPAPLSTICSSELLTIEEEVGDTNGLLTTSDSQAKYDAMLTAEFATFSFDSKDMQEWSDEVEVKQQARMDAHFAYVSQALAVSVPKLSAFFAIDTRALADKDESISNPSPVKTETSETSVSSADVSLVTSVDAEDGPQLSPIILRGLRGVRDYEDLKNEQMIAHCSNSFSDLSCWSFDMDPSDLTIDVNQNGALRRSMKCNDLRTSFLLSENNILTH